MTDPPPSRVRVGRPAPGWLVAGYFIAALGCWLAAAVVLALAGDALAAGGFADRDVLLGVHLVALGFLPLAVSGGALHVLPTMLRCDASRVRGTLALPLLCAGPALAAGIARDLDAVIWPAAAAETAGFVLVAWELASLALRAPGDRTLLASRAGVLLSTLHAAAALVFGAALADREWRPVWGMPHDRAIGVHLHLAALGWLTLLLVTVGRTLGPMLAMAPAAPRRRLPVEELVLTVGLWLLLAGLALAERPLELAGAFLCVAAVARFAALMIGVARRHRLDVPEGPLLHLATGLFFLAQAAALGIAMLLGAVETPRRLVAYVLALLVGWAAGATLGHVGKLLSLAAWTWWPPGPRPKQAALYPARVWVAEAAVFAVGIEAAIDGVLAGSARAATVGGALLAVSAAVALAGAALSVRAGLPGLRPRRAG
ncbi:MAG TPA: hypothetical protein VF186_02115 [Gaiellaceae bacterium]